MSTESLRALAAVFEVPAERLLLGTVTGLLVLLWLLTFPTRTTAPRVAATG